MGHSIVMYVGHGCRSWKCTEAATIENTAFVYESKGARQQFRRWNGPSAPSKTFVFTFSFALFCIELNASKILLIFWLPLAFYNLIKNYGRVVFRSISSRASIFATYSPSSWINPYRCVATVTSAQLKGSSLQHCLEILFLSFVGMPLSLVV